MILDNLLYIHLEKGTWFTGGSDGEKSIKSTEILNDDGSNKQGPDLPEARQRHCQVSDDNWIFVIGKWYIRPSITGCGS